MNRVTLLRNLMVAGLLLTSPLARSADDFLGYFGAAKTNVDIVVGERSAQIGNGYEVKVAYGYKGDGTFKDHVVGIFLTKGPTLIEVLEVIPSERGLDFFPQIKEANSSHVIVSFVSDYGELAKREYFLDLLKDKKLIRIAHLPAEGIPDDLP